MANAAAKSATSSAKNPKVAAKDAKAKAKAAKKAEKPRGRLARGGVLAAAKDAKAKAKDAKRAEKARKKASNDPKDMGRIRQVIRAYQVTHEYDRALPYLMIGAFVLPIAISVVIGLLWGYAST